MIKNIHAKIARHYIKNFARIKHEMKEIIEQERQLSKPKLEGDIFQDEMIKDYMQSPTHSSGNIHTKIAKHCIKNHERIKKLAKEIVEQEIQSRSIGKEVALFQNKITEDFIQSLTNREERSYKCSDINKQVTMSQQESLLMNSSLPSNPLKDMKMGYDSFEKFPYLDDNSSVTIGADNIVYEDDYIVYSNIFD